MMTMIIGKSCSITIYRRDMRFRRLRKQLLPEKAGEVYYSDPNRIILFFGDAEVTREYTKVGYFDYTEEFKTAVENNPVLEGWGNKIVLINSAK